MSVILIEKQGCNKRKVNAIKGNSSLTNLNKIVTICVCTIYVRVNYFSY
jgi:hypothetical protein